MQESDAKSLSIVRYKHALEDLEAAELLVEKEQYKSAANRSYYSIFHAIRSILAYDGIDSKKHSGIISSFQRLYIKTGIFEKDFSKIITDSFEVRSDSDYDDFYVISKEDVLQQINNAKLFLKAVKAFLDNK